MKKSKTPCQHRFEKLFSYSSKTVSFRCQKCDEEVERPATKAERKLIAKHVKEQYREGAELHRIWHEFSRRFIKEDNTFKIEGYTLMQAVDKWAKRHPSVQVLSCDDDGHASSSLVLIPHETKERFMGTTCVYIPQLFGKPERFFLYPMAADSLVTALKVLQKKAKKPSDFSAKTKLNFRWKAK